MDDGKSRIVNLVYDDGGSVSATNDNSKLFAIQPYVDDRGHLTFTPAYNVRGTASVTLAYNPAGMTDPCAPKVTFTITVTKNHPWHNSLRSLDANNDVHVSSIDALLVVNFINNNKSFDLIPASVPLADGIFNPFFDTNDDNHVGSIDALLVINAINTAQAGEGESLASSQFPSDASLMTLLAFDIAGQVKRRRL